MADAHEINWFSGRITLDNGRSVMARRKSGFRGQRWECGSHSDYTLQGLARQMERSDVKSGREDTGIFRGFWS